MIRTFADRRTEEVFRYGTPRSLPGSVVHRMRQRLEILEQARSLGDLASPRSNRLHRLYGDRAGQYSISVNRQWRICFRFLDGDAYDVEIVDYH